MQIDRTSDRTSMSEALLLALIASLPLMKPPVAYPVVITDCIFVLLALALSVELLSGRRTLVWRRDYWVLLFYAAAFAPSLIATPDLRTSGLKLASEFYLVALAESAALIVDNDVRLRRVVLIWLGATALVGLLGMAALIAFVTDTARWLVDYSSFDFGTLPPGPYPRLALTFLNANMACDYLTVSLGLTLVARVRGWLSRRLSWMLFGLITIAAASTISPGLGGVALLVGLWPTLAQRHSRLVRKIMLAGGITAAASFVVALAVTPILHPTATFLIYLPGGFVLAPSGRFLCWSAGLAEFARHPWIGHGIGIDAIHVRYLAPSGDLQNLTDAHNMFLNVGAQAGLLGIAAVAIVTVFVIQLARSSKRHCISLVLGITFLDAWLYQGLGGSFEDARHLWVLLGLLIAAARLEAGVTRADESNRTAAAPSPC
jgi:putative inorganic carbon (hco3(-)) transporter